MRKSIAVLVLMLVNLSIPVAGAYACGDKFLVVGRGIRYARPNAPYQPASILIYKSPDAGPLSAAADVDLQSTLNGAGHRFRVVTGPEEIGEALKTGQYDIVLADLADASGLESLFQTMVVKPTLLPIIYNSMGVDVAAAKKQYHAVVKEPIKRNQLLAVIDETIKSKKKS